MNLDELTLDVSQEVAIQAPPGDAYRALLARLGPENATPDGAPLPMILEPWPGGRWFRDLGQQQGHLWGFVQVIKPPTLLEISGPMFMSYPVAGHLQLRITPASRGVVLRLRHRALGLIDGDHRQGVSVGWQSMLDRIRDRAVSPPVDGA